jgi:hypothetical protein
MYVLIIARIDCRSCVVILIKTTPFFEKIFIFSLQVVNLVSGFRALVIVFPIFEDTSDERLSIAI